MTPAYWGRGLLAPVFWVLLSLELAMLFFALPAKSLDYSRPLPADVAPPLPTFTPQAGRRPDRPPARLLHSEIGPLDEAQRCAGATERPALRRLAARTFSAANARQALFAFNGVSTRAWMPRP